MSTGTQHLSSNDTIANMAIRKELEDKAIWEGDGEVI